MNFIIIAMTISIMSNIILLIKNIKLTGKEYELHTLLIATRKELTNVKAERDVLKLMEDSSYEIEDVDKNIEELFRQLLREGE